MKKKIAILGSTGSVGKNTISIIRKDKKNFKVVLLSTNSNIREVVKQAEELSVKNIIVSNSYKFSEAKKKYKHKNIRFFNSFKDIKKIFKTKEIDYSMVSISGIDGLEPTTILCKFSKTLAVVNKESLICGWNLIEYQLKKYNSNFIPIDSEHYSIFSLIKNHKNNEIEKIYITASGGPFINYPKKKFNKINIKDALKHPNWKMGKKITIDSATLMNKVFEVIEAKKIFNIPYKKISILTHPDSYVHAILKLKNGLTKFIIHDPDMKIPIFNSIYNNKKTIKSKKINFKILNDLNFKNVDRIKFPTINILNKLPDKNSLYETILISINDYLVFKFLNKKISFEKLINLIVKWSSLKEFQKYKKIKPKDINQIYKLRDYVSLKMNSFSI